MPSINDLIRINVTRQTRAVPQAGFGSILVLSFEIPGAGFTDNFRSYTDDGFSTDFVATTEVYKILTSYFSQDSTPIRAYVGYKLTTDLTVADALNRINNASGGAFYCVCPVGTENVTNLDSVAEWVESKERICFIQSANNTAKAAFDSTDTDPTGASAELGNILRNSNYTRTAGWYTMTADDSIIGAIAGRCLPVDPGGIIFGYKSLNGVTNSVLTDTEIINLDDKNYNYFRNFGGLASTFQGKMADGGFIDIIRDTDWIIARVQEAVASRLINTDKIPYTEDGANILVSALMGVIDEAIRNGVLDVEYTVATQDIVDIPFNDRANRKFPNITVTGRYVGAIQSSEFQLTLSV